jgi:hypothetical protein
MKPNDLELMFAALGKIALRSIVGAAIGMGIVFSAYLHYTYFASGIDTFQIVGSAVFVGMCGTLSIIYGKKMMAILLNVLQTTP